MGVALAGILFLGAAIGGVVGFFVAVFISLWLLAWAGVIVVGALSIRGAFRFLSGLFGSVVPGESPRTQLTGPSPKLTDAASERSTAESLHFRVAGITKSRDYPANVQRLIDAAASSGRMRISLVRDRNNVHDANAVKVTSGGGDDFGYVPREQAAKLAPLLDRGKMFHCSRVQVVVHSSFAHRPGLELTVVPARSGEPITPTPILYSEPQRRTVSDADRSGWDTIDEVREMFGNSWD